MQGNADTRLQRDVPRSDPEQSPVSCDAPDEDDGPLTGDWQHLANVARAQCLVCVQADCTADEALVLMQARARATDRRVVEIADEVLEHRIWFD